MRTIRCSGRRGGPCLPPPPVDRMTDACENITFLQLCSSFPIIRKVGNVVNFVLLRSEA